ncbi:MAG: hypothetical protein HUU17_06090 [Chthonomonadales bacterium]|nr:hypothetical protein [Chthonomonadales bacterium]
MLIQTDDGAGLSASCRFWIVAFCFPLAFVFLVVSLEAFIDDLGGAGRLSRGGQGVGDRLGPAARAGFPFLRPAGPAVGAAARAVHNVTG